MLQRMPLPSYIKYQRAVSKYFLKNRLLTKMKLGGMLHIRKQKPRNMHNYGNLEKTNKDSNFKNNIYFSEKTSLNKYVRKRNKFSFFGKEILFNEE